MPRQRAVSASHPWITFTLDLEQIRPHMWVMLGACGASIEEIVGVPLTPPLASQLNRVFVSKGVHGTAAIEGNTLTLGQVEKRLQGELDLPPSQEYLGTEIDNISRGLDCVEAMLTADAVPPISEESISAYNRLIMDGLEADEDVVPGEYATVQHGVAGYRAPTPQVIRAMMPSLVEWLNDDEFWHQAVGHRLAMPIVKAVVAHLYVAWIHPFGDGNGRTARMLEAEILAREGVPGISYHILSTHYNLTRTHYYKTLAATSQGGQSNPYLFIDYALGGLVDGLKMQLDEIKAQHREIMWRDYVHNRFHQADTKRATRLRWLAIDLSFRDEPTPRADLWNISSRVASAYRGRTSKTVTRDLNELSRMNLVRKEKKGWAANIQAIDAFVSASRSPSTTVEAP